jgi:hypothetical protein
MSLTQCRLALTGHGAVIRAIIGHVKGLLHFGEGAMQSNAALYGVVEIVERDRRNTWSYFGATPRKLSRGFPCELPWQEWWGWGWDTWPVDTLDHAFTECLYETRWAERHIGYPRRQQRKVSLDLIEACLEVWTLQEEHGDDFETLLLWEDPAALTNLTMRPWLRGP